MSNIFDFFPSNFLKAADLGGQPRQVTIEGISAETLNDGSVKPALSLVGATKKLILNRTNATALAQSLGPDFNAWAGKQITLFSVPVNFQGTLTDAIRVQAVTTAPQATSVFGGAQTANVFANVPQQETSATPPQAALDEKTNWEV
jgi:hypothetical protein